jgi:hypothetical protein
LSKSVVCQCVCSLCLLLYDRFLSLRSVYFSFRVDRIVSFRKARVENPVEWFFLKNFIGEIRKCRKDFKRRRMDNNNRSILVWITILVLSAGSIQSQSRSSGILYIHVTL